MRLPGFEMESGSSVVPAPKAEPRPAPLSWLYPLPTQKQFPKFHQVKACDPVAMHLRRVQTSVTGFICEGWQPPSAAYMLPLLRRMLYGDALWSQNIWRLERLYLETGRPHYRLFYDKCLIGVTRIKHDTLHEYVLRHLAAYITVLGFTPQNSYLEEGGAKTAPDAETERLPILFHVRFKTDKNSHRKNRHIVATERGW